MACRVPARMAVPTFLPPGAGVDHGCWNLGILAYMSATSCASAKAVWPLASSLSFSRPRRLDTAFRPLKPLFDPAVDRHAQSPPTVVSQLVSRVNALEAPQRPARPVFFYWTRFALARRLWQAVLLIGFAAAEQHSHCLHASPCAASFRFGPDVLAEPDTRAQASERDTLEAFAVVMPAAVGLLLKFCRARLCSRESVRCLRIL
ncbi:hypothetical protein C8Q73DRAFT_16092 [Cubamyces lactineus]|nr:hypothetical protein C8Q73DRAFT_16092 [Cubamyces lactineus]